MLFFRKRYPNRSGLSPDVSAYENQIIMGAIFVLMMGFNLAMVPVVMFPTFKKQNEILALGYVVFRGALETFTYIVTAISMSSLSH